MHLAGHEQSCDGKGGPGNLWGQRCAQQCSTGAHAGGCGSPGYVVVGAGEC